MKYPIKRKKQTVVVNTSKLGMTLENDLDITNQYYLREGIAVIHKKPTPITVVDVSYPARNKAKIVEAYYKTPSTTDYNGIYQGRYLDFDAKETKSKTSIPLSNIHSHQVEHLRNVALHGGIAFLIVHFIYYNEYFLLPIDILLSYWDNQINNGRKSIPYSTFKEKAQLIKFGLNPRLDYLKVIEF